MNSSTEVVRTYNFAEASCINFASEILSESSAARPESSKKDELYIFFMRTSSPRLMSPSTKLNYSVDKYKVIRPLYTSPAPHFDVFASIFAHISFLGERHSSMLFLSRFFERAKDKEKREGRRSTNVFKRFPVQFFQDTRNDVRFIKN